MAYVQVSVRLSPDDVRRADRLARSGQTSRSHVFQLAVRGACVPDARCLRTLRTWAEDADRRGRGR